MSDDFDKLKLLKAEQIFEKTHITKNNINNILSKSFEKFDKIQFNGFISILEREYSLNLQELRDEYQEYAINNDAISEPELRPVSNNTDKPRSLFWIVIIVLIIIVAVWLIYNASASKHQVQPALSLNTTISSSNVTTIDTNSNNSTAVDVNSTKTTAIITSSTNITKSVKALAKNTHSKKSKISNILSVHANTSKTPIHKHDINATVATKPVKTVQLLTKAKLWLGITNMKTWKQQQKIVTSSLDLNSTGEYLLILGHGMVQIKTDDKNISFPQPKTVFLMLKNGKVTQLTHSQFIKLNKGKLW